MHGLSGTHTLGLAAWALGDAGSEPDRGEGRLDRVAGLEVLPVLGGEVEERQQLVGVVGLSAPTFRLGRARRREVLPRVCAAATEIEVALRR